MSEKDVDVIHIHGDLDPVQKFHHVNDFCCEMDMVALNPLVLVATLAVELGSNNPHTILVMNFEWSKNISTLVQNKGQ